MSKILTEVRIKPHQVFSKIPLTLLLFTSASENILSERLLCVTGHHSLLSIIMLFTESKQYSGSLVDLYHV